MKYSIFFMLVGILSVSAESYAQKTKLSIDVRNGTLYDVVSEIEKQTDFMFFYKSGDIDKDLKVNVHAIDMTVIDILADIFKSTDLTYVVDNKHILIAKKSNPAFQQIVITGTVIDNGEPLPGVNVVIKGTTTGVITDFNGKYSIAVSDRNVVLVFSFIGYASQEFLVGDQRSINVTLSEDTHEIEEVVVVGYGTMRKSDLTGSVVRANIDFFRDSPNTSIIQSLQGSVPGFSVGQVSQAGQEADLLIRGKTSISGELSPLIVVDGVIFRGSLIDLNPHDIESIDILKDASSSAIYGSQAANGVVLVTTKRTGGIDGKPIFNYSGSYSFQSPIKKLKPGGLDAFYKKQEESDIFQSRTEESGYLEKNPNWDIRSTFAMNQEVLAYNDGRSTDWYDILTNQNMYTQNHNLSLTNRTKYNSYLISLGFLEQDGYMAGEYYNRINARINVDNTITDWFKIGVQSFFSISDYSGQDARPDDRYIGPYSTAYDPNGKLYQIVCGGAINPILQLEADDSDKRLNLFGNIYADINIPFVKGLSYKVNFANNYKTESYYYFRPYANNFTGEGSKNEGIYYDQSVDNIVSYKRLFNKIHKVDVTLVYGFEKRTYNSTRAISSKFTSTELGYNRLQAGDASLQEAHSNAWEESSLYSMVRLFYSFRNKYLFTGTIRRDGFSGFSEKNKFGLFPSVSFAWILSEESFLNGINWINLLKIRASYGSVGNRTVGRYQTLARVSGGYNYVDIEGQPLYTQYVSSLASSNLKWETTTGVNLALDFGFANIISGSIDYYNNNTTNLLYEVDIPGISRYEKFPDNLGKINNRGLEINLNSTNMRRPDFEWSSIFTFSRNRNTLKSLLGFDNDGDGKEDDLVSEGLFIGESLDAIYTYQIDGKWQVDDEIPAGFALGSHKIVDRDADGNFDPNDRTIIGYRDPKYSFSIGNSIRYKNWGFKFFINSIQGGKNYYMGDDAFGFNIVNSKTHFLFSFPDGVDYWTPENPNARYERPDINVVSGLRGRLYTPRSFIRLQDIILSYDFPSNLIEKIKLKTLRLYVSGKNVLTITKWNGWDPETGQAITLGGRPVIKSWNIGVNVEF